MPLSELTKDRNNNLNLIRFLAAMMVIFSHAYPLSCGAEHVDLVSRLTEDQTSFGNLAVCTFFFFSGFFINRSVHRSQSAYQFFKARCFRIFPCLAVVVLLSTFVLGSIVTTCSLREYLTNPETYRYLRNIVLIPTHNLPGVFQSNIYRDAANRRSVNGSLWTLPVEFVCYIVCYVLWKLGLSEKKRMKCLILPFLVVYLTFYYVVFAESTGLRSALRASGIFYCGMVYDTYREHIRIRWPLALLCGAGLVLSVAVHLFDIGVIFCLPYILSYFAFGTRKKWSRFGEKAEISYGIYLCGFPIQQTVTMLFGGSMNPWLNFLISLPLAVISGLLLSFFVEQPLMRKARLSHT